MLKQVLLTIPFLAALIFIYVKYKSEKEDILFVKLIGYYLLGCFRFNFNNLALPVGFAFYLIFFNPQLNKAVKKAAAYLGLFAFFSSLFIPALEKAYFERQRVVTASSGNLYSIQLNKDIRLIKQKLGISEDTKIEDFDVDFEASGEIRGLGCKLVARDSKGVVLYYVTLTPGENKYKIQPKRVDQWLQFDRLINEEQFFYALERLNFRKVRPQADYPYYTVKCEGTYQKWGVKDFENYLIKDKEITKLKSEDLPVEGYGFWIFGNKKTGATSYTSDNNMAYILSGN